MTWQPIETAPKDGTEILVAVRQASVWLVRNAVWDDGKLWAVSGFDSQEELAGWWSPSTSVGERKLEGYYDPTHWAPFNPPE